MINSNSKKYYFAQYYTPNICLKGYYIDTGIVHQKHLRSVKQCKPESAL